MKKILVESSMELMKKILVELTFFAKIFLGGSRSTIAFSRKYNNKASHLHCNCIGL